MPDAEAMIATDGRTVAVSQEGRFLTALPDGTTAWDRTEISGWESFVPLTAEAARDLLFVLRHDWVLKSSQAVLRSDAIRLAPGHVLDLGGTVVDLRYNTPLLRTGGTASDVLFSFILLREGWQIEEVFLFRPLIYYTAFRAIPVLTQAALSIASLVEFGAYAGAVHVITDRPKDEFLREVGRFAAGGAALAPAMLSIQTLDATDWVGYVAAKYCILDWAPAWTYQPLLFLDTDIAADTDLTPLLAAAATAGRPSAPAEPFSSLHDNPAVGADLLRRDGRPVPDGCGFNGGTLAVPNLANWHGFLEAIRTIIGNHEELHGRDGFRWVDQEVANYVGVRTGTVDVAVITPFVRYAFQGDEANTSRRAGLLHFWPPRTDGMAKEDAMNRYATALRTADASRR